ncbi:hypothetical protein E2C01_021530 [Portunus trituberculatus]|uniref:Uncharacterized protein n=1 Tax=Portunus trituberculatus TaxID=210409 RepID=A0A5B7E4I2_PORTR|nr:hypothetical protein [Portunus trituberculatus]
MVAIKRVTRPGVPALPHSTTAAHAPTPCTTTTTTAATAKQTACLTQQWMITSKVTCRLSQHQGRPGYSQNGESHGESQRHFRLAVVMSRSMLLCVGLRLPWSVAHGTASMGLCRVFS